MPDMLSFRHLQRLDNSGGRGGRQAGRDSTARLPSFWLGLFFLFLLWNAPAWGGEPDRSGIETANSPVAAASLTDRIASQSQNGTLIFSRGDCLAVRAYTASPYTHVAMVLFENGEPQRVEDRHNGDPPIDREPSSAPQRNHPAVPVVYDSMNGAGVRKLPLAEYLETQAPDEVHLYHPDRPLTEEEAERIAVWLDSQLGRPYAVKHHLTGRRARGMHCSEYVTDALMEIGWLTAEQPAKVSPASLLTGIVETGIYEPGGTLVLPDVREPVPEPEGRCSRLWLATKQCTLSSCRQLSRWFLCR
jgi:hypothetical protein